MSIVLELSIPRDAFTLGHILPPLDGIEYMLEAIVPLGEAPIPFVRVHDGEQERFVDEVMDHPDVNDVQLQTTTDGLGIYSLDWDHTNDAFFTAVIDSGGHLLAGDGVGGRWQFTLQFPDYDSLTAFEERLQTAEIASEVLSVESPWAAGGEVDGVLTDAQREALELAYRAGYYDIPRQISTSDLAEQMGISDQAVTERLRRGIVSMIEATLPGIDGEKPPGLTRPPSE